jgi:hypothetical protein
VGIPATNRLLSLTKSNEENYFAKAFGDSGLRLSLVTIPCWEIVVPIDVVEFYYF